MCKIVRNYKVMNPRIQQTPEKEKHKLNHIKASYNKTAKNQR